MIIGTIVLYALLLTFLAMVGFLWAAGRHNKIESALARNDRMIESLPVEDRLWVKHHLHLSTTDVAEWPAIIGKELQFGGIYWTCARCPGSSRSHIQSGCKGRR